MKAARLAVLVLLASAGLGAAAIRAADAPRLVVVELFTSQGCSSCPPADRYLGELAQEPGVLALSYHVDYWNYIGWADPFASKFATQRQRDYAKRLNMRYVYTPQMVIDGVSEGVGSERQTIAPLIRAAASDKAPRARVSLTRRDDGALALHIDAGSTAEPATLWLVGFDTEHSTPVLRGENEGETAHDYQVVRSAAVIGVWRGGALDLVIPSGTASGDGAAVLVQQGEGHGRIIGAAAVKPPTT